jgi:hypothetical protein
VGFAHQEIKRKVVTRSFAIGRPKGERRVTEIRNVLRLFVET